MKNIIKTIIPSSTAVMMTLFLPIIASIYFAVTHFADKMTAAGDMAYIEAQHDLLGRFFINENLVNGFNRLMDFVFWGVIALVVMVLIWVISSIRVSIKNHYAQEEFTNFRANKFLWHQNFFVVFVLRTILIVLIGYSFLAILGKVLPRLSVDISSVVGSFNAVNLRQALVSVVILIGYQLLVITSIKIFKHLQAD